MRWTIGLGTLFGIPIRVHLSFLALLGYFLFAGFSVLGLLGAIWAGCLLVSLFALVVMHELAHALVARRLGVGVRDILLLPIGGVARLERMPRSPGDEILIALAGPLSNFALAILLAPLVWLVHHQASQGSLSWQGVWVYVRQIFLLNLALGTFNLAPAFPMDGGRVLRALLARKLGYFRATLIAAKVGRVLALSVMLGGLVFGHYWLACVALFVLLAGHREETITRAVLQHHIERVRPPGPAEPDRDIEAKVLSDRG